MPWRSRSAPSAASPIAPTNSSVLPSTPSNPESSSSIALYKIPAWDEACPAARRASSNLLLSTPGFCTAGAPVGSSGADQLSLGLKEAAAAITAPTASGNTTASSATMPRMRDPGTRCSPNRDSPNPIDACGNAPSGVAARLFTAGEESFIRPHFSAKPAAYGSTFSASHINNTNHKNKKGPHRFIGAAPLPCRVTRKHWHCCAASRHAY